MITYHSAHEHLIDPKETYRRKRNRAGGGGGPAVYTPMASDNLALFSAAIGDKTPRYFDPMYFARDYFTPGYFI